MSHDQLLTAGEVANRLRVSIRTLQAWRSAKTGPPCVRIGQQVRYPAIELEQWIRSRTSPPHYQNSTRRSFMTQAAEVAALLLAGDHFRHDLLGTVAVPPQPAIRFVSEGRSSGGIRLIGIPSSAQAGTPTIGAILSLTEREVAASFRRSGRGQTVAQRRALWKERVYPRTMDEVLAGRLLWARKHYPRADAPRALALATVST